MTYESAGDIIRHNAQFERAHLSSEGEADNALTVIDAVYAATDAAYTAQVKLADQLGVKIKDLTQLYETLLEWVTESDLFCTPYYEAKHFLDDGGWDYDAPKRPDMTLRERSEELAAKAAALKPTAFAALPALSVGDAFTMYQQGVRILTGEQA